MIIVCRTKDKSLKLVSSRPCLDLFWMKEGGGHIYFEGEKKDNRGKKKVIRGKGEENLKKERYWVESNAAGRQRRSIPCIDGEES